MTRLAKLNGTNGSAGSPSPEKYKWACEGEMGKVPEAVGGERQPRASAQLVRHVTTLT